MRETTAAVRALSTDASAAEVPDSYCFRLPALFDGSLGSARSKRPI